MGEDKYESKFDVFLFLKGFNCFLNIQKLNFNSIFFCLDEELIKWGWPEDVWFHVDKLSSAHVYLRLKEVGKINEV